VIKLKRNGHLSGEDLEIQVRENVIPYNNFNAVEKGHGSQPKEKQNIDDGGGPL